MSALDDAAVLSLFASSAFFIAVSVGLLYRYRQVSQKINASNDLGKDLWSALEQRLRRQDERVLDMMGRFEVIQSRLMEKPTSMTALQIPMPVAVPEKREAVMETHVTTTRETSQVTLDETEMSVLKLLSEKPRSSVEIKELTGKSREHAARLMKALFDSGLVSRDSSKKPFVYQLTENGRNRLPSA